MLRQKFLNGVAILATILALLALNLPNANAAPPGNDNFSNATVIGEFPVGLPLSDSVNISESTIEPGEPQFCSSVSNTIWYAITPSANTVFRVDGQGSDFADWHVAVFQAAGPSIFDLTFVGCTSFSGSVTFPAQAGVTYYIQAGKVSCGYPPCSGGLQIYFQEIVSPANDNFDNAVDITDLPFSSSVNNLGASTEPNESFGCYSPRTVWYKFTPPASGFFTADMAGSSFADTVLNYFELSGTNLIYKNCTVGGGSFLLYLVGGTTYYFQAGDIYSGGGELHFNLQTAIPPQPSASFGFAPTDPSSFDNVQFFDSSSDPGGVGIQSQSWKFGDGTIGVGCCPTHRYTTDGNYTTELTVTTFDGRSATISQVISVRTHDIVITKFMTPSSANAGQTRQLTVGIRNTRYAETVRVELYRSTTFGFQLIGYLDQTVPVRAANRTTDFQFNYTFTSADAATGKVNFRAVAIILTARDALPTDNESISAPTKIAR
jgi:PKD repeat protein